MCDQFVELQRVLDGALSEKRHLQVLEAGCGSRTNVRLPVDSYVIGIDISAEQLQRNSGLDEKILGDIQSYPLPNSCFDVVVCWEVLEHVSDVTSALINLLRSSKDGGIVILALPNVYSVKGMVTKLTPHAVHCWFYKEFMRDQSVEPFPTYLRMSCSPAHIMRLANSFGFLVKYFSAYESPWQQAIRTRRGITSWRWEAIKWMCNVFTLGKISVDLTDFILVLEKPSA
jgi:SAM-dependent methyltransferase